MIQKVLYVIDNGFQTIVTPAYVEEYDYTMTRLKADAGKILKNGSFEIEEIDVPDDEVENWEEVDKAK